MTHLFDTNAYAALRLNNPAILELIRASHRVYLPTIVVVGELLFGFRLGSRFQENLQHLHAFLQNEHVACLPVTQTTADHYSRLAESLRRQGRPIPTNDIWIAALAVEHNTQIVTFDQHFAGLDGVSVVLQRS